MSEFDLDTLKREVTRRDANDEGKDVNDTGRGKSRRPRMTRPINLKEYASREYSLSVAERDALRAAVPSIGVEPCEGESNLYRLTPASIVGAVEVGELSVFIKPKIDVPQLLSLACYAMGAFKSQPEMFDYPPEYALPDVLALALVSAARRAFSRGLLHGYVTEEEALYGIRGRIRFDDQIRRRFSVPLPVEVRYDEFYGRHSCESVGQGGGRPAWQDASAFSDSARGAGMDCWNAGQYIAGGVHPRRRSKRHLRPSE